MPSPKIEQDNFAFLVQRAMAMPGHAHLRRVMAKELLHYDILFALEEEHLLNSLTLQGSAALRLCYGATHLSEDLTFAGGRNFDEQSMVQLKDCLDHHIGRRYGLETQIKTLPTPSKDQKSSLKTHTRQLTVSKKSQGQNTRSKKLHINVTNAPSYSREPQLLRRNYDFLPQGYGDMLVLTENREEIMTEKLLTLVNSQHHPQHRAIWDLQWLIKKNIKPNIDWLAKKIHDHSITNYPAHLTKTQQRLPAILHSTTFQKEMIRYLPDDVQQRTLQKKTFLVFLQNEINALLEQAKQELLAHL